MGRALNYILFRSLLERFNQNCGRGGSAGFSPLQRDICLAALKRRERRAPNDPEPGCKSGHDIFENALGFKEFLLPDPFPTAFGALVVEAKL